MSFPRKRETINRINSDLDPRFRGDDTKFKKEDFMRVLAILGLMMFIGLRSASAATVDLSDGRVVQGDIVKQDDKSVQINVDGVTMTYYADEIKDVDGTPFKPAVSEPAVQPESAQPAVNTAGAAIDPEKKALILKFIDVFGTRQALNNNFALMIQQVAKEKPDEAVKIRDRVKIDEIIDRLLPIYDRNFSADDLKAFIAFYGSAEGQKLITTIPQLMKESVKESVKYMQEKFPEVKAGQ